jgi:YbgC/YbaW family acyl-CoA thioester hydrolase
MPTAPHCYELTILERHLDTFGHVNNATYLELLEEARWDWITQGGYGLEVIRSTGQGPTILQCSLRFVRELLNREPIAIESSVVSYRGKVGTVAQRILKAGSVACEAEFAVGLFDVRARKLINPTERWLAAFGLTLADWEASASVPPA